MLTQLPASFALPSTQGGAISYLAGLTVSPPVGGIVGLSTWLPLHRKISQFVGPHVKDSPVFHGHGNADQVVQFKFGVSSVEYLKDTLGLGSFRQEDGKTKGVRFEVRMWERGSSSYASNADRLDHSVSDLPSHGSLGLPPGDRARRPVLGEGRPCSVTS